MSPLIRNAVKDWLLAHPVVDQVAAIAAALLMARSAGWLPAEASERIEFYAALAGLCGLVLASATFVCTLTYQSSSHFMRFVRQRFGKVLSRNWTAIIGSTFAAAITALAAILLDASASTVAAGAVAYSLAAMGTSFVRVLIWLRHTLFLEEASEKVNGTVVVPFAPAKKSTG